MAERPVQASLWSEPARRWVFHVDMDAFFASVEQLDDPSLRGKPVVVHNSPYSAERLRELAQEAKRGPKREFIAGVRGVVASASYEARAFGVRSAMPLARALALCPDAMLLPGHFDRYREVARHLRQIWSDFSPTIEPMSLDEAYLDMTGCELSGGPIMVVAERLKTRVRDETGLTASVGAASSKLMAKIASDLRKPDGLVVVEHGREAVVLAPLPVRALPGVGPRTADALSHLGIQTIGELAAASPAALARLFGADHAESLLRRSVGIDNEPVQVPGDPKSVSRESTMAEDTCDLNELRTQLQEMSDRVGWTLRRDGFVARCIYIKLRLLPARRGWRSEGSGYGRLLTRRCTLPSATDAGQEIFEVAQRLLTQAAHDTGLGTGKEVVRLLGVGTATLSAVPRLPVQAKEVRAQPQAVPPSREANAFGEGERRQRLNASVDAIRERYGFGSISVGAAGKAPQQGTGEPTA